MKRNRNKINKELLIPKTVSLTRSRLKSYVFLNLIDQTLNFTELKLLGQSSSISNIVHYFEDNNIIELKNGEKYGLATEGQLIAFNYLKFLRAWPNKSLSNFLNNHIIDDIPYEFIDDLYLIDEGNLLTYNYNSPYESLYLYNDLINRTHSLNIVLSICSNQHIDFLYNLVKNDLNFKLNILVNESILKELYYNYFEKLDSLLKLDNVNFYKSNKELDIFLSSGSNFISIQLFDLNHEFDGMYMFYDTSKNGTMWGRKLFDYFLNDSEPLNIKKSSELKFILKL